MTLVEQQQAAVATLIRKFSEDLNKAVAALSKAIKADADLNARRGLLTKLGATATALAALPAPKKAKKNKGYEVTPKPCPVCQKPNGGRRWRYYCADHRKDDPKNTQA
jgi:hypothetical protein